MAQTPRHHLVPQFLLKRFADASGKLVMVKRDDRDCSVLSTVNNACKEAGFYRIETDDLEPEHQAGHDPEAIEKALAAFEGRAQTSIRNLEAGSPPWSLEDRYNLSLFTAFQYVRGWSLRREMNELATLTMRREMVAGLDRLEVSARRFLRSKGKPASESDVQEFLERAIGPEGPRVVAGKSTAIQTAFQVGFNIAEILFTRPIRLLKFDDTTPLLTSDTPVATWSPDHPDQRVVGLVEAAVVSLPLSPTLASSFARGGHDAVASAGAIRAHQINTAVADSAHRWIYHAPGMTPLVGLTLSAERPRWVDEKVASRVDPDGTTYRELWRTIQR